MRPPYSPIPKALLFCPSFVFKWSKHIEGVSIEKMTHKKALIISVIFSESYSEILQLLVKRGPVIVLINIHQRTTVSAAPNGIEFTFYQTRRPGDSHTMCAAVPEYINHPMNIYLALSSMAVVGPRCVD